MNTTPSKTTNPDRDGCRGGRGGEGHPVTSVGGRRLRDGLRRPRRAGRPGRRGRRRHRGRGPGARPLRGRPARRRRGCGGRRLRGPRRRRPDRRVDRPGRRRARDAHRPDQTLRRRQRGPADLGDLRGRLALHRPGQRRLRPAGPARRRRRPGPSRLRRPAGRPQPAWVRAVALAGVALGVLGVLISAGMYLDLFVSCPARAPRPAADRPDRSRKAGGPCLLGVLERP